MGICGIGPFLSSIALHASLYASSISPPSASLARSPSGSTLVGYGGNVPHQETGGAAAAVRGMGPGGLDDCMQRRVEFSS